MTTTAPPAAEPTVRTEPAAVKPPGMWAPLAHKVFFWLWIATLVSMIGTWLQQVTAAWVMTELTASSLLVSLVQACTLGPMWLLALPSGALGDLFDRRKLLIVAQLWAMVAAGSLAVAAWLDMLTPGLLLAGVTGVGIGAAFTRPGFQAIVPELVPRSLIKPAVTLNSVAINVARAIGPALAGVLVVAAGPKWAFTLNAMSFLGVIGVLVLWKRRADDRTLPPERFVSAMTTGLSYTRHAPELLSVLFKTTLFIFPASALWALLPVVISQRLGQGAGTFGVALGAIGIGAVSGVFVMQRFRHRLNTDATVRVSALLFGLCILGSATLPSFALLLPLLLIGGAAWLAALSSLTSAAQVLLPDWVRARGMSIYTLVFTGSMALGSMAWGGVADLATLVVCLLIAAGCMMLNALLAPGRRLSELEDLDLTPTQHQPAGHDVLEQNDLPPTRVLVTVTYDIDPQDLDTFLAMSPEMRGARRRRGAFDWSLWADPTEPHHIVESFKSHNWAEHLRMHSRLTQHDKSILERAMKMDRRESGPVIRHLFAADGRASQKSSGTKV